MVPLCVCGVDLGVPEQSSHEYHQSSNWVESLSSLQLRQTQTNDENALGTYHAGFPMERVHLDILGPINPRSRFRSSYVVVDQFTKWVELAALPAQNADLTAKAFLKHFFVTFGCPLEVHTDQGKNFTSDLFVAFCKLMEITETRTTPYHPAGNG